MRSAWRMPSGSGMPGLELRRVGIERMPELVELRGREFGDSREEAESFERATFASSDRQVYGAFAEGRMVGACTLGFSGRRVEMTGLVIEGAERGKGYGRAMLRELIAMLSGKGLEILLDVNSRNAHALHLYEKAGFVAIVTKEYWRCSLEGMSRL